MLPKLGHTFGDDGQFLMECTRTLSLSFYFRIFKKILHTDSDWLECFAQIDRTILFDSTWMMSSQWLHVSTQPLPIAWSYGDVTCKSPPPPPLTLNPFPSISQPPIKQSHSHSQDLQPPSSSYPNSTHDTTETSPVELLGLWISLSSRKVKRNRSLNRLIRIFIFAVCIWKSSWKLGVILSMWVIFQFFLETFF